MGSGGGMHINGRPFDMDRIDERVPLGDTEIWEISGQMMSHPVHIHGVQFEVLSRDGGKPIPRDAGLRDTVLVRDPVELRTHPGRLSITHKFCPDAGADFNVSQPRQASPDHHSAWRRIVDARKISAELGDLGQIVR